MKPCGFLVNTGTKQSELQTVDSVAVAVVLLNADADAVASVVLLFVGCFFKWLSSHYVPRTFHYQIKRNTKQRHTMKKHGSKTNEQQ